ncbi:putative tail protein [Brevundimonas phage vB_BpoS-Gurke]|uniref:receptor protein-tyrosine kinase n=1 Tax=Brevundimonas phage vB_BpoS-Gurke TaxID=2948599 RepID=A0A9E7SQM2_9CAUD|nr:putative tail protein [Brevundimonas phage vB_BpoS-Gurke]
MTDYTSILHLPQVGSNQEQKEATINTAIAILEASANDTLVLSLASGDVTLNTDQFTKYFLHQFTGHAVARQVTIPATPRWFAVENRGAAPIVFKVMGASGLTAELPANRIGLVVADGTNVRFVVPDPISGMGLLRDLSDVDGLPVDGQLLRYDATAAQWKPWTWTAAFTQLSDTPSSLGGNAGKLVAVNAAGNRLEFITSAANINSFIDLDDTPTSYASAANRHVVVNAAGTGLTFARPYLRENSDFPSSYNTHANKMLRVNATADGVIFSNPVVGDLTDGPGAPTINEALLYVRVNAAGTALEYVTGTGGPVNFTELHDTPSNFTGHKGKLVRVGQDEDRLIFSELKLTELSDTPNSFTGAANKILKVNATQSGVIFGSLKVEELADGPGPMAAAQRGLYLRVNATNSGLEYVKPALTELAGVPSFTGQGGKFVRVNDAENGLDFAVNAVDMAFIGLSDTPANYQNSQNKFVAVNAQGTGLIFVPAPTGGGGGGGPYSLDQITDVDAPDPSAGQVLTFRDGWWRPETPSGGGGVGATALSELTDVNFTLKVPEENDVLTFQGGFWVAKPANATPIPQALDDLTDVDLSEGTLANGEVLTYWDGKWIHAPVQVPSGDGLRFGEHRDWRLFFRTADTPALEIAEFVLRAGAGLPQLAVGGTPSANANAGAAFDADKAFDGDPATFWRTGADGADQSWLRYTFAEPQEVNAVSLTFGAVRQLPITWAMQFSDDGGLTWITAWSETRAFGWNAGETVDTEPARAKLAFAMLSDSPGAMSAHPGKFVRVDEDGVRLEYVELPIPATSLEELTDVQFTAPPAEDQVLTFKDGIWQPKDPASTVTPEMALNDLTDVDTAGQADGMILGRRGGVWRPLDGVHDLGQHAYWRILVQDTGAYPGTTTVIVAEVSLRDAPGGAQTATGGAAIGTGGNINGAFDGTSGDVWTAYLPDAWIGYHYAAPIALQEVALTASTVTGWAPNYTPEAFKVQYSDDGLAWFDGWEVAGSTGWVEGETRVYTQPGRLQLFTDLDDTPNTYATHGGKQVRVRTDATGLEFVTPPTIPNALDDLTDVDLTTTAPATGNLLTFEGGKWIAKVPAPVSYTDLQDKPTIPVNLADLGDVSDTPATAGDYLRFVGGEWVADATPAAGATRMGELSDVDETGVAAGDVLIYHSPVGDPAEWRPGKLALDALSDVAAAAPVNGQALVFRDGSWTPEDVAGAGLDPDRQQVALLIVNPGAEDGMTGWTNTAGAFTSETSAGSLGAPFAGTRIFRATQNTSPCEMAQTIALDAALWDYIDIGRGSVEVAFRYGRVNTDGSTALVALEALDAVGTLITSSASPAYTTTTTWQLGNVSHVLPPLTRSVRLVVRSTRTGTFNYGAFDAFSGLIKVASAHPALSDLPDVGPWTSVPVAGQVLTYRGGVWMNETPSAGNLDALTDVTLTTPVAGQILVYRAGQWINESPQGAGVPSNGSHAHWRLLIDQTDGDANQVGIQDIWFRQTKTGPQLATGGTPSASSSTSGQGPEGAFDGVTGGAWFSAAGNPVGQWIAYAFPAPVEVRYLDLKGSQDYPTRSPRAFKVQWSDDGSTWTTAWTVTGQTGWAPNQTRQFHAPLDLFFTDLADAPPSYIGQARKPIRVKADETGLEFGHDSLGDLTDVSFLTTPQEGEVLTRVSGQWRSVAPTTGSGNTSNWTAPWRGALVERTTDLTSVTWPTTVPWQAATADTDGFYTTGAATRLTIPAGITKVRISAHIAFTLTGNTGSVYGAIHRNGVAIKTGRSTARQNTLGFTNNEIYVTTRIVSVVPGDYFEIYANSNISGVNSILTSSWLQLEVIESDYAINPPEALDDLTDVTLGTPVQDYVLTYDGGVWKAKELPASSGGTVYMADIGDVEMPVGGPGENDVLRYQAGKWRPLPAGSADGLFLDNAMIGSGQGAPTTPRPSGSLYIDEVTGQISQSLKDVPTVAAAPTVVQHVLVDAYNALTSAQPITAALSTAPTEGNWLVALLCDQSLATAGAGWTLLPGSPVSSSTRVRPSVAYKQAAASETLSQTPFVSGSGQIIAGALVIYEIAGMSTWAEGYRGVVWEDDTTYTSSASGMARAPLTARALHDGLGLGLYVTRPNSSTLTADAPWTTLSSGVAPTGGGNRTYVATSAAAAAGTSIAPKASFTGATEAGYVTILLDNGPAAFEEGWRPYTGNIALDDLTDVTAPTPANGQVLTYRDGAWSPESAEGEFSGTGEPTATAPLGKVYQQRDSAGNAWVSTMVPAGATAPTPYAATGARQSFVVGPQISSLTFKLWGGGGGTGRYSTGGNPAAGGFTQATFAVNEGDLIELDVPSGGQGGFRSNYGGAGGWPDGGFGGLGDTACGGGGGSARVWRNGVLMAVAGGGGGGSGYTSTDAGAGGGSSGQSSSTTNGGTGGTQFAGGYDGNDTGSAPKRGGYLQGAQGTAAVDRFTSSSDDGGGGGGGYYGGGGGGGDGQPGGGGSGYLNLAAGVTGVTEAGDRLVPPRTTDADYQANIGVGYPTENVTGPAPNGGDGLIVVLAPPYVQGWRRLATSDDVDTLALVDLLKVTLQGDGDQDYVLTAQDRRAYRKITSSIDKTITIPPNSLVPFPIGASFSLQRGGDGRVSVLAGSGVSLEYPDDMQPRLRRKNSVASLVQIASNVWSLFGDLEPI